MSPDKGLPMNSKPLLYQLFTKGPGKRKDVLKVKVRGSVGVFWFDLGSKMKFTFHSGTDPFKINFDGLNSARRISPTGRVTKKGRTEWRIRRLVSSCAI